MDILLFVSEKDSMHAAEVAKLNSDLAYVRSEKESVIGQLAEVRGQLEDQEQALKAAQRLTLQLEKKEEALSALKDEGNLLAVVIRLLTLHLTLPPTAMPSTCQTPAYLLPWYSVCNRYVERLSPLHLPGAGLYV